jgi:hypothetical protein
MRNKILLQRYLPVCGMTVQPIPVFLYDYHGASRYKTASGVPGESERDAFSS